MGYIIAKSLSVDLKNNTIKGSLASNNVHPRTYERVVNKYDNNEEFREQLFYLIQGIDGGSTKCNVANKTMYAIQKTIEYLENYIKQDGKENFNYDDSSLVWRIKDDSKYKEIAINKLIEELKKPKPECKYVLRMKDEPNSYLSYFRPGKHGAFRYRTVFGKERALVFDAYEYFKLRSYKKHLDMEKV